MKSVRQWLLWYGLSALFLGLCLLPIVWGPDRFPHALISKGWLLTLVEAALLALAPIAVSLTLRASPVGRREARLAGFAALACAGFAEVLHFWITDKAHYFPPTQYVDNTQWQLAMHDAILHLNPAFVHSYRFLPDCIVCLFQWLTGDYVFSRIAYRVLGNSLLFAMIYRYARLYLGAIAALSAPFVILLLYPLSILKYAGQLVDPASHLSFVACLYCLATGFEPAFGAILFLGIFAKESVIVMAACRLFYGRNRLRSAAAAAAYGLIGFLIAWKIRLVVNRGGMAYNKISGVDTSHFMESMAVWYDWLPLYLCTLGFLLPGALLGWKLMDRAFQATCLVVTFSVIVSSFIFSWPSEVRNLVPAFIPLAIIGLKYVESIRVPAR